mmetsp:Transcript_18796/g.62157  ORF Transcript_18796/g.62157 Transcript_18796/m.62157 type:complete len:236 (+) Transcript_18796:2316-3023(+)
MAASPPRPCATSRSSSSCGSCVDLPQPGSPTSTAAPRLEMAPTASSAREARGSAARAVAIPSGGRDTASRRCSAAAASPPSRCGSVARRRDFFAAAAAPVGDAARCSASAAADSAEASEETFGAASTATSSSSPFSPATEEESAPLLPPPDSSSAGAASVVSRTTSPSASSAVERTQRPPSPASLAPPAFFSRSFALPALSNSVRSGERASTTSFRSEGFSADPIVTRTLPPSLG